MLENRADRHAAEHECDDDVSNRIRRYEDDRCAEAPEEARSSGADGKTPGPGNLVPSLMRLPQIACPIDETRAIPLELTAGEVSFHHTLAYHRSGINRTSERRIGIGVSYIPTRVRHVGTTRLSATLVRGTDTYGHFDHEPAPLADEDAAALRAHADSIGRFWTASESIPAMALMH